MEISSSPFWRSLQYDRTRSKIISIGGPLIAKSDPESDFKEKAAVLCKSPDVNLIGGTSVSTDSYDTCDCPSFDKLPSEKPSTPGGDYPAGLSADKLPHGELPKMSDTESEDSFTAQEFRAGGKRRVETQDGDDTDSHGFSSLGESDFPPSPCGSTFSTAAPDSPSFNPTFDTVDGSLSLNSPAGELCLVANQ